MRILITGGAGFIGSHLVERHLEHGDEVNVFDDFSTGRRENLRSVANHPNLTVQTGSVMDEAFTSIQIRECDLVYHLAAAVGVRLVIDDPIGTIERNICGTMSVLRAAAEFQKPVLITSTSEVYGKQTTAPFSEDDDLVLGSTSKPRWSYACSKAVDEFLVLAYCRKRRLKGIVARLFNVVGPRQRSEYGMVTPTLVRLALAEQPLVVFGEGTQTRCFLHVADAVDALTALAAEPRAYGQVFNVGGAEEISILDLARRIKRMTGSSASIHTLPYAEAYAPGFEDMDRRVPDCTRLNEMVGFAPRFNLDAILDSIIAYERSENERLASAIGIEVAEPK
jgi:UDP-glucose 4-epimerase